MSPLFLLLILGSWELMQIVMQCRILSQHGNSALHGLEPALSFELLVLDGLRYEKRLRLITCTSL